MPAYSDKSKDRLSSCHPRLQMVFNEVIKYFDCTIICGFRGKIDQDEAVAAGNSKTPWPVSKHNKTPSLAVDAAPYPIDWNDTNRMRYFAGFVMGVAAQMGLKLRWGGDWDSDTEVKDQTFNDLAHFEVKDGS